MQYEAVACSVAKRYKTPNLFTQCKFSSLADLGSQAALVADYPALTNRLQWDVALFWLNIYINYIFCYLVDSVHSKINQLSYGYIWWDTLSKIL